jgi:hypothetical protein
MNKVNFIVLRAKALLNEAVHRGNLEITSGKPTMDAPREVARDGQAGREKLHATLYPEKIGPLTCTIGERNQT